MFIRLANLIVRYPKWVFGFTLAVLLLAAASMAFVAPNFSSDYGLGDTVEASIVDQRLTDEFGISDNTILMVFSGSDAMTDPTALAAVDASVADLAGSPFVEVLITPLSTGSPTLLAENGESVLVIARVPIGVGVAPAELEHIESTVTSAAETNGLEVAFGGGGFIDADINHRIEAGLIRAELVSIPIALVVLLLVFGTLVAAGMPLVAGVASIVLAMAVMMFWSSQGFQSIFAINVITMLGLGLGIDYSLFLVKRYRDELHKRSQPEALSVAIQTVGKAIFFSGITVILGLGGTQFFDMPQLRSLGQGGMIVTASTMFFGLTLLPATLQLLGTRINKGRIGRKQILNESGESAFWARVAHSVMARPVVTLIATLAVLGVMAFPLSDIRMVPGGVEMLPVSSEPRQVTEHILANFPQAFTDPIYVIVQSTDDNEIDAFIGQVEAIDGVTAVAMVNQTNATLIEVVSQFNADDSAPIVNGIRDMSSSDLRIQVGGTAAFNADSQEIVNAGLLPAGLFVFGSSYMVLLLTFGSVLLPLKAMFMSALSISASLGVVVWVFQWGNLAGLLNFTASGGIISMVPILIACILFGLSMDYEVLLLSRIQEEWLTTGDNEHAIATGLAHTGQVVSGAATVMVAVFGGFVLADVMVIKSLGFGLAFAVLLDATIVRGVLVPTTMTLMGRWNWWAPAWITRVVNRLGMSHAEPREASEPVGILTPPVSSTAGE